MHALGNLRASSIISIHITTDQSSYNLFTSAGSPSSRVSVTVTVDPSVNVETFTTGSGWAAGTVLKLRNQGHIRGATHDAIVLAWGLTINNILGTIGTTGSGFKAVALNGFAVRWIGGNNASQLRGVVA